MSETFFGSTGADGNLYPTTITHNLNVFRTMLQNGGNIRELLQWLSNNIHLHENHNNHNQY